MATTNEQDLLKMIRIVHNELENLLDEFDLEFNAELIEAIKQPPVRVLQIGDTAIEQVTFTD